MHGMGMFDRAGQLTTKNFKDSGADWLKLYKPYINNGETVIASPHKVYGPETNDMVLQLRKRGIDKIVLAGMSANLCTEAHMREFMEQGFEVQVVSDATAAAQIPGLVFAVARQYHILCAERAVREAHPRELAGGRGVDGGHSGRPRLKDRDPRLRRD